MLEKAFYPILTSSLWTGPPPRGRAVTLGNSRKNLFWSQLSIGLILPFQSDLNEAKKNRHLIYLGNAQKIGCFFWDVFPKVNVPELYFGCSFYLTLFSAELKYTPKCGKIRQMLYLTCQLQHAKYGQVGYPWKEHLKFSSDVSALGLQKS